jgi:LAS superfamily LD-carboxypeptidase LdcB
MTTKEYCRSVEQKERLHRKLSAAQSIREDQSPLVSLKESGFNRMFEPSMMDGYEYRVREAVHEKIGRIGQSLEEQDKVLIIRSAWRSFEHQRRLWEKKFAVMQQKYPHRPADEIKEIVSHFIAPPSKSMHATGGAVDALIRQLLIHLFEEEDFVVDILEYWHFDYGNAGWATEKGKEYARYGVIEELEG